MQTKEENWKLPLEEVKEEWGEVIKFWENYVCVRDPWCLKDQPRMLVGGCVL